MPFSLLKRRRFNHRLARSIIMSLLCILIGVSSAVWQAVSNLKRTINIQITNARQLVEGTLDNARQAGLNEKKHLGHACNEFVELQLGMQTSNSQNLHSVNFIQENKVYCSSLYFNNEQKLNLDCHTNEILYLMSDILIRKRQILISYRGLSGNESIITCLYGDYSFHKLSIMNTELPLILVIGHQQLHTPADSWLSINMYGYLEEISTRYPFSIIAAITPSDYAGFFWAFSRTTILLWFFVVGIVGYGVFRFSGRQITVEYELIKAFDHDEFVPYFQAIVSGDHTKLAGCEVLIRWLHPTLGIIPPDSFIPLAEQYYIIKQITRTLMNKVCQRFAPIAHSLPKNFHFAFNINPSQFSDPHLIEDCRQFLQAFRGYPVQLVLELTERELLISNEQTKKNFEQIQELGVLIAIDDYGTGNSGLKYFQSFDVDIIKIDKSFVKKIGIDSKAIHIIENIIDLARRLDLLIVAEGVEDETQATYLKAQDVTFLQGYLYGKPMPMEDFKKNLCYDSHFCLTNENLA